jgi:hypothetical protein
VATFGAAEEANEETVETRVKSKADGPSSQGLHRIPYHDRGASTHHARNEEDRGHDQGSVHTILQREIRLAHGVNRDPLAKQAAAATEICERG